MDRPADCVPQVSAGQMEPHGGLGQTLVFLLNDVLERHEVLADFQEQNLQLPQLVLVTGIHDERAAGDVLYFNASLLYQLLRLQIKLMLKVQ